MKYFMMLASAILCLLANGNSFCQERKPGEIWTEEFNGKKDRIWWMADGWTTEELARSNPSTPYNVVDKKVKNEKIEIVKREVINTQCINDVSGGMTYFYCWEIWRVTFQKRGPLSPEEYVRLDILRRSFNEMMPKLETMSYIIAKINNMPRLAGASLGLISVSKYGQMINETRQRISEAGRILNDIQRTRQTDLFDKVDQIESEVRSSMNEISNRHSELEEVYRNALEEEKKKAEEEKKNKEEERKKAAEERNKDTKQDQQELKNTGKQGNEKQTQLDMNIFDGGSSDKGNSQVASKNKQTDMLNMDIFGDKKVQQSPAAKNKQTPSKNNNRQSAKGETLGSVMLLMDTSGSMEGSKIASAKNAAISAAKRALDKNIEVAVFTFSGDCGNPIKSRMEFSNNFEQITNFINSLNADGGTPLAPALEISSRYLAENKAASSQHQMTVLLADGDNQCGNIVDTLNVLKQRGQIFRHETIGLEIQPFSQASKDLQDIAARTGGKYRTANDVQQLASVFNDAIDTITMLEMLGGFGNSGDRPKKKPDKSPSNKILDNF
jgi:Mg-chelatase subunit ChlD